MAWSETMNWPTWLALVSLRWQNVQLDLLDCVLNTIFSCSWHSLEIMT